MAMATKGPGSCTHGEEKVQRGHVSCPQQHSMVVANWDEVQGRWSPSSGLPLVSSTSPANLPRHLPWSL